MFSVLLSVAIAAAPTIIEDDFHGAMLKARGTKKLVFVEVWAEWCPSCMYMKGQVLTRPTLGELEKNLVFAAINSDLDKNAYFIQQFETKAFPTLYFFDPNTERLVYRYEGAADEPLLRELTERALELVLEQTTKDYPAVRSEFSSGEPDADKARAYLGSVDTHKPNLDAIYDALATMRQAKANEACVVEAARLATLIPKLPEQAVIVAAGLNCAGQHRDGNAEKLVAQAEALLAQPRQPRLTSEMVGELYMSLGGTAQDEAQKQAFGKRWLAYVEESLRSAKSTPERMSYNADYAFAALAAKKSAGALAHLARMEKAAPKSYNPPYMLGRLYLGLDKYKEALAAGKRALAKTQEPAPRIRIANRVLIPSYAKLGDVAGQRAALNAALQETKRINVVKWREGMSRQLEGALKKLDNPTSDAGTAPAT